MTERIEIHKLAKRILLNIKLGNITVSKHLFSKISNTIKFIDGISYADWLVILGFIKNEGDKMLVESIEANNIDLVKILVKFGANIHYNNEEPLTIATSKKDACIDIAEFLMDVCNGNFDSDSDVMKNVESVGNPYMIALFNKYHKIYDPCQTLEN